MTRGDNLELVCPAGTPAAMRSAVEAGAHAIYCGFNDETNARNFPGLNFSRDEMADGIAFAHRRGAKVLVAINTFPRAGAVGFWRKAVDDAARRRMSGAGIRVRPVQLPSTCICGRCRGQRPGGAASRAAVVPGSQNASPSVGVAGGGREPSLGRAGLSQSGYDPALR